MHVYQPISKCKRTGQVIVWFALRGDLVPPGPGKSLRPNCAGEWTDWLSISLYDDDRDIEQGCHFLSQCMTESETAALKSFLTRHTDISGSDVELRPVIVPLTDIGFSFEELGGFDEINLSDWTEYDLPWKIVGRVIEGGR